MVVAVLITTIALLLVTVILSIGLHLNTATIRERRWQLALESAESGVEAAVTNLRTNLNYAGTSSVTPGATYETTVANVGDAKVITSTGYVPAKGVPRAITRRIQVTYAPEPTFVYAIFSATSVFVNSGSGAINGDVFANESVALDETSIVRGNVEAATGSVTLANNAEVQKVSGLKGNVVTGGFADVAPRNAVTMAGNAVIQGDLTVRVAQGDPTCLTKTTPGNNQAYNLDNAGTIGGLVRIPTDALISQPGKLTGKVTRECVTRSGKQPLPTYTFDPANYPGLQYLTTTQFNAGVTLSNNTYVRDDGTGPVDLAKATVTQGLALIMEPRTVHANTGDFFADSIPSSAVVQIISLNSSQDPNLPSIEISNQFNVPASKPAVLVFSNGYCKFKNSTIDNGAVYCNGMDIKNGLEISYDGRIKSLIGFGGAKLIRSKFVEISAT